MKALQQLGFLKLSLRPDAPPAEEDHRVLALFKNRAELKKAYGELQDEVFHLKDLIKQQEAATQRVQDMLATLEGRLGAAETAYSALVFYQLRRLWQGGRELLSAFVADLVRQQEERERRAHLAQYNRAQFARRQQAEQQLGAAQAAHAQAGAGVSALEAEGAKLTRIWHYFKRRALERRVHAAQAVVAAEAANLSQARVAFEQIEATAMPEFPGLTLAARRAINLAAIAYAEVLCLRLVTLKTPLVALARAAIGRREAGDDYGSPKECVLLMGEINRAQQLLSLRANLGEQIKARSERLKSVVRYRAPTDSSPVTDSIAMSSGDVLDTVALGSDMARVPNVLAEDTWDLFRILVR
jgi:hypothetical protein